MQVHRRWLKLALLAVVVISADAQVYTMQSLDRDTDSTSDSNTDSDNVRTPTPTARRPTRTWIPITNAPSDSSDTEETPETPRRTPTPTTKTPRPTTKTPRAQAPAVDSETASRYEATLDSEDASDSGATEESPVVDSTEESGSEEGTDSSGSNTKKKKKKTVFTKSPYLEQTTPVPNGIHTANDDSGSDESASGPTSDDTKSDDSGSSSKTTKPKTTKPKTKKKTSDSASGSDSESSNSKSTKKDSKSAKQDSTTSDDTDSTQNSDTTPSPDSSTTSASQSGSASSSGASVMTDSASADKTGMSNTLMLGLMMGGAVALVILVAVFVYIKTNSNEEDEEDDMDPVLRTARHDGTKGTAQSSTVNANYHDNHNMSPMEYSDGYYGNQHNAQYDQEPYGHHGQPSGGRITYNDPNLDMLTPRSQIALAHSQMSLPPMAQTGHSNGSSQYSDSQYSSFYAQSAYSTDQSVSQVVGKYPGMRQGKGENDVAGSSEEESDFEGDSVQDMSQATNVWNTAGRNRAGTAASGMDRSMAASRFAPSDTRSTAASDYNGKNRFQESEYTEYRMSTGYESSYAGGNSGYDKSFAATKSGYEKSYASDQSGYDSRFAGGKSFQSSGFSEYERAVAPSRNRGDSTNSDASRFTDASYY
ncbi:hypothetical protein L917_02724 [Phytophthora nicotianae]|uniref:Uncharacterized protein n=1 Tax=Phytophthora nicotianae TaxID=4792 RepID=W2LV48_PHYNI|nr:hypothetical protein L917_02724 [Phytophthora nicotianae]